MAFNKITIAGGGVLGSQIAFQAAYCGYRVCIWLRNEESVQRTKETNGQKNIKLTSNSP